MTETKDTLAPNVQTDQRIDGHSLALDSMGDHHSSKEIKTMGSANDTKQATPARSRLDTRADAGETFSPESLILSKVNII